MNYTKPEVTTLGDATTVIETITPRKPASQPFEFLKTCPRTTWMSNR